MKSGATRRVDKPVATLVVSTPSTTKRLSAPLPPSTWMPRLRDSSLIPGADVTTPVKSRPFGIRSMISAATFAPAAFCLTSMSGASPVTVTVSATPATPTVRSTFRISPSSSRMLSCFDGWKPCSVAVTWYTPGGSAGNR